MSRHPSCTHCGRRTAEIVYGSPKFDARLRRRIDEGHAVLGGPATGHQPQWLCLACGAEFGGPSEPSAPERLDSILRHVRTLLSVESDLRTDGLIREASSVEKALRGLLIFARAEAPDETTEGVIAALEPHRGETWSEDDTVLAYSFLKQQSGFPGENSIGAFARTLGRSRGDVTRKLAALNAVHAVPGGPKRRRPLDQRIVHIYANATDRLNRDAVRIQRLRQQRGAVGPRRRATRATRFEFWSTLNDLMEREGTTVKVRPAGRSNWRGYSLGRAGFAVVLSISTREQRVGCELYIGHQDAKHAFDQLDLERSAIEAVLGPLEWQRLPGKRACRIVQYRDAALDDLDEWPEIVAWCKERVQAFHRLFQPRIRTLVLVKR